MFETDSDAQVDGVMKGFMQVEESQMPFTEQSGLPSSQQVQQSSSYSSPSFCCLLHLAYGNLFSSLC